MSHNRIAFHTLGCKTNQYETDAIARQFQLHGFERVDFQQIAEVYLINTCTVTGEADRKSRQMLRQAGKRNPNALIVAMGYHAELCDTRDYADLCIGTQGKSQAVALVKDALQEKAKYRPDKRHASQTQADRHDVADDVSPEPFPHNADNFPSETEYEELGISDCQSDTRAYLKIEDGCNAFCSYCAIPLARGRVRSRAEDSIRKEAAALIKAGYREIVLTGIHLCSYGLDRGLPEHAVAELAVRLAEIPGLDRIRLGSLEPLSVTAAFLEILRHSSKICPHFHLSLQSGCDRTLIAMNRRYSTQLFRQVVHDIRTIWPEAGITTDVIAGFPGETEQDFEESLAFCREIGFSRMHVFRFSPRKGTRAAAMPHPVAPAIAVARSNRLQELALEMSGRFHQSLLGTTQQVLTEQIRLDGSADGYTASYVPVVICKGSHRFEPNQLVEVRITGSEANFVTGSAVKPDEFVVR